MLANVLKSESAMRASILVVRGFVNLRHVPGVRDGLVRKIEAIERRAGKHDVELQKIVRVLRDMLEPMLPEPPKRRFGFRT